MSSSPRSLGEPHVTAAECAAAGIVPAEFSLSPQSFVVTSRLREGRYLALAAPAGTDARVEVVPCAARSLDELARAVRDRVAGASRTSVGPVGEVTLAGAPRLAVTVVTGAGEARAAHVGALVVDPMHAPRGMLLVFSAPWPDEGETPSPEEALSSPVFEALARSLRMGPPSPTARRAVAGEPTPPRPAEVEYVDGGERFRRRLGARETIGRARDNTILLTDTMTSKHHAVIEWDGERYVLLDRGSINGTRVDGHLARGPVALAHNTKIELGRVSMRFREVAHASAQHLHELVTAFEREGLALPHVPAALGPRLQTLAPWFFSTEPLPAKPLHGDLGVPMGARDYLVVCHGMSGGATLTLQYCLGLGPLRLALECPWPGPHDVAAAQARQLIASSFLGVRALVGAVQQCLRHACWPAGAALEVRALHGAASSWGPVGPGFARKTPSAIVIPAPETLADALAWVHAL